MEHKKSLGQNFLNNPFYADLMVKEADIQPGENILEIGPGMGVLTEKILNSGANVTVIEKDDRLIPILNEKFKENIGKNLEIVHLDVLEYDPADLKNSKNGLKYKLIANIPYYITGAIFKKFLSLPNPPETIVIMIQKEVADRITKAGNEPEKTEKESILSISVKAYGKPKYINTVKAGNFNPPPNVDSAILGIFDISKDFFVLDNLNEEWFFKVVKAGFAHKRKVLIKNLEEIAEKNAIEKMFTDLNLDKKIRAEDIHINDWKKIAINLQSLL